VHDLAVAVADDLDLDVARVDHEPLQEHRAVTERGRGLPARALDGLGEGRGVVHHPHTPAAAPERGLHQHREPESRCDMGEIGLRRDDRAGQHRHAGLLHQRLGLQLGAHRGDRVRGRAHERQPRLGAGAGEAGVLGQEAVAGVHGVGPGRPGRRDQQVGAEVGVGRGRAGQPHRLVGEPDERGVGVGVGVHGDGGDAQRVRRAHDPRGDLAPVGDQQFLDRC
jgi:hypothetical protein